MTEFQIFSKPSSLLKRNGDKNYLILRTGRIAYKKLLTTVLKSIQFISSPDFGLRCTTEFISSTFAKL